MAKNSVVNIVKTIVKLVVPSCQFDSNAFTRLVNENKNFWLTEPEIKLWKLVFNYILISFNT